ncbi:MAG: AAA family ATPase [archaeon YNP-LCB-003-016]|uniref:AAA family ATPase n=1 Tax=Candidatus Culexarchaeum yellowstonense TaxID=2928963 RepID=UPI0026F187A4|nr:AAA family ATPase [Candidatus Culexarchaeum yellowstonense]MCR6691646.1 AAA family ATPase [Candidatus Culexarchaeum yellowstonense]
MTFIREVVLENFMSYEYGRIPLSPGLNIVTGPNGSGKSSILLGISVALGAQYTERGRRLRDLIRWGSKLARVSVVLDNSVRGRRRPYPRIKSDVIRVSRYLRADGSYWFEVNGVEYSRGEIQGILKAFGFNPDNMLVIMHQNMVEEFAVVSSRDKLRLLEDAVGLTHYRERIMDVRGRLEGVLKDEAEVKSMLEKAKANLDFWRGEYEKLKVKDELMKRKGELEVELAWSKVNRKLKSVNDLKARIEGLRGKLDSLKRSYDELNSEIKVLEEDMIQVELERRRIMDMLIEYSRIIGRLEALGRVSGDFEEVSSKFSKLRVDFEDACKRFESIFRDYVGKFSSRAILGYRIEELSSEVKLRERDLKSLEGELESLLEDAKRAGPMPSTVRDLDEVNSDLMMINARIEALGPVSPEAEKMYNSFNSTFNELSEKAKILSENREAILRELNDRVEAWRKAIMNIVSEINGIYRDLLSELNATGYVRVTNLDDVEKAGLEILVGFRGSEPILLDGYSQSGGERTTAIVSFLLAAQRFIKSPFRAVDEFDIHMDPRNREAIFKCILSYFKDAEAQYLAITPSPVIVGEGRVNIIFVQNVGGKSEVKVVSK